MTRQARSVVALTGRGEAEPSLLLRRWKQLQPELRDGAAEVLWRAGLTAPKRSLAYPAFCVLTFHRVLPRASLRDYPMPGLAMTPEQLEAVLSVVAKDCACLPVSEAFRLWSSGATFTRPVVAVSFDDGGLDNFEHALPVLQRLRIRGTFYVPVQAVTAQTQPWYDRLGFALLAVLSRHRSLAESDLAAWLEPFGVQPSAFRALLPTEARVLTSQIVEEAKRLPPARLDEAVSRLEAGLGGNCVPAWAGVMNADQLRQLCEAGHEVGSHSMTHPCLTLCTPEQLQFEIVESKRSLERALGKPVTSFCYPGGDYDDESLRLVQDTGYLCAVTTRSGLNRPLRNPRLRRGHAARGAPVGSAGEAGNNGANAVQGTAGQRTRSLAASTDPWRRYELSRVDMDYANLIDRSGEFSLPRLWFRVRGLPLAAWAERLVHPVASAGGARGG